MRAKPSPQRKEKLAEGYRNLPVMGRRVLHDGQKVVARLSQRVELGPIWRTSLCRAFSARSGRPPACGPCERADGGLITAYEVEPKRGQLSASRKAHQGQRWFRGGLRWRVGSEARVSALKRRQGLDRCLYHGLDGMNRWVGFGVIARNLLAIARHFINEQA